LYRLSFIHLIFDFFGFFWIFLAFFWIRLHREKGVGDEMESQRIIGVGGGRHSAKCLNSPIASNTTPRAIAAAARSVGQSKIFSDIDPFDSLYRFHMFCGSHCIFTSFVKHEK